MQLKLRDFLATEFRSLPNEIKMCRTCTSNVSCDTGEVVIGATGGQFEAKYDHRCVIQRRVVNCYGTSIVLHRVTVHRCNAVQNTWSEIN